MFNKRYQPLIDFKDPSYIRFIKKLVADNDASVPKYNLIRDLLTPTFSTKEESLHLDRKCIQSIIHLFPIRARVFLSLYSYRSEKEIESTVYKKKQLINKNIKDPSLLLKESSLINDESYHNFYNIFLNEIKDSKSKITDQYLNSLWQLEEPMLFFSSINKSNLNTRISSALEILSDSKSNSLNNLVFTVLSNDRISTLEYLIRVWGYKDPKNYVPKIFNKYYEATSL